MAWANKQAGKRVRKLKNSQIHWPRIRFNEMDLVFISLHHCFNLMIPLQRFYYDQIGKKCLILFRGEISKR